MNDISLDGLSLPSNATSQAASTEYFGRSSGAIPQTERLYTVRSRNENYLTGDGDRGQRAYIKILTNDAQRSVNRTSQYSQPTSLTSGENVLNQAVNGNTGYANFLLTDMSCSMDEKLQIVETFGDAEVSYYFGRQPIMFSFGGLVVDSVDNNWFIQLLEMYTHVMRGSELARNYELVKLVLPNMTLKGTINSLGFSQNGQRDTDIHFQFSFFAKEIIPTPVSMPNTPITNDPVINWGKVQGFLSQAGINDIKIRTAGVVLAELKKTISDPLSTVKDYASSMMNVSGGLTSVSSDVFGSLNSVTGGRQGGGDPGNIGPFSNSVSDLFGGIGASLTGVRASLFSPIYGVLSSLTKLITNITGDVRAVMGSFLNPVQDVLRDVKNISNQAIGVVNLISNSIDRVTGDVLRFDQELRSTISALKKTAGVISNAPETISGSIRRLVNAGKLSTSAKFLTSLNYKKLPDGTHTNSKLALLNSGPRRTRESGAVIKL